MIDFTRHWYALYTKSRNEKIVARQLEQSGIEVYLPLHKTMKQWSDRRKTIYEPLFRSYVFVKVNFRAYEIVLSVTGVVCFVTIGKEKVAVPECQIEAVKIYLGEMELQEPLEYFETGSRVEVAYGVLRGLQGILQSTKDYRKLVVQIDAVNQNIILKLPSHLLKKINKP